MSAASKMWQQPTFEVLPNATSSQGSLFGPTLFDWPAGPTSESAGPEAVPAPVSPVRAKEAGLMTLVTSGRNFIGSSASASLQQSLESSLRTRLDTAGGTLYRLTWKVRHTPLRRRFLVRRVLEVQTRDTACTLSGWPTPTNDDPNNVTRASGQFNSLVRDVNLCGWPTTKLAGWSTPSARDWKDSEGMATTGTNPDGSERSRLDQLGRQVQLAGWPTPTSTERSGQGPENVSLMQDAKLTLTPSPMRLTA